LRPGCRGDGIAVLTLYQAEWCPFSARVRMRLTELGLAYVTKQVEPRREERDELRAVTGGDSIPTLVAEDGTAIDDADAIVDWLNARYEDPPTARGHRAQARAHDREPAS
jgi:glutathione S-transferase